MKKKVFTVLLSMLLILGTAGNALAAEPAGAPAGKDARILLMTFLTKYFEKIETERPNGELSSQDSSSQTSQIISLVNRERAQAGLESLKADAGLSRLAQLKAEDMAKNRYFSHTSPTYGSAFDMMQNAGISYRTAGENIARGQKTAEAVMNGWMNSSGHRANILGSGYNRIGVGCAKGSDGTPYWVQIFAG